MAEDEPKLALPYVVGGFAGGAAISVVGLYLAWAWTWGGALGDLGFFPELGVILVGWALQFAGIQIARITRDLYRES
jgi:hypothetical protein